MEELIRMVTQKTGISETQARSAVEAIVSFLKDKMPGGFGNQVESFIKGNADGAADNLKDKISGLFN